MAEPLLTPRDRILALLARQPGLHLREIPRRIDLSLRSVRHHLGALERDGQVVPHRAGRFLRWFPRNLLSADERALVCALRVRSQRKILESLLRRGASRFSTLQGDTGLSPATLARSLQRLVRDRLLVSSAPGEYQLADPGSVRMRLSLYRSRFPDLLADAAFELLEETR